MRIRLYPQSNMTDFAGDGVCHIKTLPYLSVVQSIEGSYTITIDDGESYETGAGGIFIAPSAVKQTIVHHVDPVSRKIKIRWVFFDVVVNGVFDMDILYDYPVIASEPLRGILNGLLDEYFATKDSFDRVGICVKMARVLTEFSTPRKAPADERMFAVLQYMKTHYAEKVDIGRLASIANLSLSRFYALFKRAFGKSALAYLNEYRLSVASDLLIGSDFSVGEIAQRVGIGDQLYFSRMFKRKYGISPLNYRK